MELADIQAALIDIHRSVQQDGGFEDAASVSSNTRPLSDLKGFDSMLIPQAIRRLARVLGQPFEKGQRTQNIYVDGRRKLSIAEISVRFKDTFTTLRKEVSAA